MVFQLKSRTAGKTKLFYLNMLALPHLLLCNSVLIEARCRPN